MTTAAIAHRPWYFSIPVLGWIAHDLIHGTKDNILYFLVIVLTLVVLAVKAWGLVALAMIALATVPVIFATLVLITLGK